jgi:hypothetical protein
MAHEVSDLKGAINEVEWEQEGLINSVDELCNIKVGGFTLNDTLRPFVNLLVSPPASSLHVDPFPFSPGCSGVSSLNQSIYGLCGERMQKHGGARRVFVTQPNSDIHRVNIGTSFDHPRASS